MSSASTSLLDALCTPSWLADRLDDPGVKVLDASWYMPAAGRNPLAEFRAGRIPGSHFFDVDGISDPSRGLPHMLPTAAAFGAAMDALGIKEDDTVVVYDRAGVYSAPRAWWTFQVMGHKNVVVLDGGYPAWTARGLPLDEAPAAEDALFAATLAAKAGGGPNVRYTAQLDATKVRSLGAVVRNIESKAEQVVDARSAGRFVGTEPEPRAGLRGGHIPGSKSVPFTTLVSDKGRLKPAEELSDAFAAAGVDLERPLVGSCGSGLTACIIALAYFQLKGQVMPIFDGSWMEWGANPDVPAHTTQE